jgi:hypothetical protein
MLNVGNKLNAQKVREVAEEFDTENILHEWQDNLVMNFLLFFAGKFFYAGHILQGHCVC